MRRHACAATLIGMCAQQHLRLDQPACYRLRLQGRIAVAWDDWLQQADVQRVDGQTVVTGVVRDQVALFGLLSFVRDLGAALIAVELIQPR